MNRHEKKLFYSKTPAEYIDNSLKCRLRPGEKARITRLWLTNNPDYSINDIKHARNTHPYWKRKKMRGSYERNERRKVLHDYSNNGPVEWNERTIKQFIEMNQKNRQGNYIYRDHELAEHFSTSIPGIQHYRRKFNMVTKIIKESGQTPTSNRIFRLIGQSETKLRKHLNQ